jgi:hypothetical protein
VTLNPDGDCKVFVVIFMMVTVMLIVTVTVILIVGDGDGDCDGVGDGDGERCYPDRSSALSVFTVQGFCASVFRQKLTKIIQAKLGSVYCSFRLLPLGPRGSS